MVVTTLPTAASDNMAEHAPLPISGTAAWGLRTAWAFVQGEARGRGAVSAQVRVTPRPVGLPGAVWRQRWATCIARTMPWRNSSRSF